jgi:uncharacterized Fe-S center protein
MISSKVWFTNLRTKPSRNLLKKLENLVIRAGIEKINFQKKLVALKIHFGEPGNLAYLRPNYAASIVKLIHYITEDVQMLLTILKLLVKTDIIPLPQIARS